MSTEEVARRLGVKPETVYAYVSRGVLHSTRDAKGSWFDPGEVDALATRPRRRRPVIGTSLTSTGDGQLRYRGRDVTGLVHEPFEEVARLLWQAKPVFTALPLTVDLPSVGSLTDHLRIICAYGAVADPLRFDLRPAAVAATGARIIATMVDTLPGRTVKGQVAQRLWGKLSPRPGKPSDIKALNAALVLLADHSMATSTVAARVTASVRANPYAVVAAGLSAFEGPLHGAAATQTYRLIADAITSGDALAAYAQWLRTGGHAFAEGGDTYPAGDVRASTLLDLIEDCPPAVTQLMWGGLTGYPTIEFALAALAHSGQMPPGAAEAIFVIARTAGWIAHAMEEYQEPGLRFRLQGRYSGTSAR